MHRGSKLDGDGALRGRRERQRAYVWRLGAARWEFTRVEGAWRIHRRTHRQLDESGAGRELFGDTLRRAPRLTPLEARAIRLALEFVGPMIAADAQTPLDRVRLKLEETFGQFELSTTASAQIEPEAEDLVGTLTRVIRERRLV